MRKGGGCGGGVMDGWCASMGRRGSQVEAKQPSQGLASGSPSCPRGHPLLTEIVEPLSLSNKMGGGMQQATVSGGERWTSVDFQRVPQNRNNESSMPVSVTRCRFFRPVFPVGRARRPAP